MWAKIIVFGGLLVAGLVTVLWTSMAADDSHTEGSAPSQSSGTSVSMSTDGPRRIRF